MIEYICSFEEEYGFLVSDSMKFGEELIRCKDCIHYDDWDICDRTGDEMQVEADGFCKWAERGE